MPVGTAGALLQRQGLGAEAALAASFAASEDEDIDGEDIDGDDEEDDDGDADGVPNVSDAGAAGGVAVADGVTTAGGGVDTAGAASSFLPQAVSAAVATSAATRMVLWVIGISLV